MYKIFSYLLLAVGLLVIFFSLHSMYQVFAEGRQVPSLVQADAVQLHTQAGSVDLPMGTINTVANLGLFVLFMVVIAGIGAKIAGLGCQLLKNERIHEALLQLNKIPPAEVLKKL